MPPNVRHRNRTANLRIHEENVEQPAPAKPDWYAPYEGLRRDWNEFIKRVRQTGVPSFYAKGYMDMIPRIRELMENTDIQAKSRAPLIKVLENHQRYLSTRKHISGLSRRSRTPHGCARLSTRRCGRIRKSS